MIGIYKKMRLSFTNDTEQILRKFFYDNSNILIISSNLIKFFVFFKIPSYGFSIRVSETEKYIRTELLLNNTNCYCPSLGYKNYYHDYDEIKDVIKDILNVLKIILEYKQNNILWIEFYFTDNKMIENSNFAVFNL